jgi:hypothetical protein
LRCWGILAELGVCFGFRLLENFEDEREKGY